MHDAEVLADLLGTPLPADWADELARQSRRDHLEVLAITTADSAVELIARRIELEQQGSRLTNDDLAVGAFVCALIELDRGGGSSFTKPRPVLRSSSTRR